MKTIRVYYYAILREARGRAEDTVKTNACTARELYEELKKQHGFRWPAEKLKVAINDEITDWATVLKSDDEVAFLPPVAGG
jgi:molybdopterin synthase sulfur carrier subunit